MLITMCIMCLHTWKQRKISMLDNEIYEYAESAQGKIRTHSHHVYIHFLYV